MTETKRRKRSNEDGYRYVREYRVWPTQIGVMLGQHVTSRWALWERVNGRAKRVGTAHTEEEMLSFLQS